MAYASISPFHARVSAPAMLMLDLVGRVDSYHSCHSVAGIYNDVQMKLSQDERDGMHLMMKGLRKLFPFDPERDQEHQIVPRHGV